MGFLINTCRIPTCRAFSRIPSPRSLNTLSWGKVKGYWLSFIGFCRFHLRVSFLGVKWWTAITPWSWPGQRIVHQALQGHTDRCGPGQSRCGTSRHNQKRMNDGSGSHVGPEWWWSLKPWRQYTGCLHPSLSEKRKDSIKGMSLAEPYRRLFRYLPHKTINIAAYTHMNRIFRKSLANS